MLTIERPRESQYAELTDLLCCHRARTVDWPFLVARSLSMVSRSTSLGSVTMLLSLPLDDDEGVFGAERSDRELKVSSILASHTLRITYVNTGFMVRAEGAHFNSRLLDAVTRKYGRVGLTLTLPILVSDRSYRFACERWARRSIWVTPPATSEIHISFPCGGRSTDVMSMSSVA